MATGNWFCNGRIHGSANASCIIMHLVRTQKLQYFVVSLICRQPHPQLHVLRYMKWRWQLVCCVIVQTIISDSTGAASCTLHDSVLRAHSYPPTVICREFMAAMCCCTGEVQEPGGVPAQGQPAGRDGAGVLRQRQPQRVRAGLRARQEREHRGAAGEHCGKTASLK